VSQSYFSNQTCSMSECEILAIRQYRSPRTDTNHATELHQVTQPQVDDDSDSLACSTQPAPHLHCRITVLTIIAVRHRCTETLLHFNIRLFSVATTPMRQSFAPLFRIFFGATRSGASYRRRGGRSGRPRGADWCRHRHRSGVAAGHSTVLSLPRLARVG